MARANAGFAGALAPEVEEELAEITGLVKRFLNGEILDKVFKPRRLHFGVYGQRQPGNVQMVRVKVPSGVLTSYQLRAVADVATDLGAGVAHITTRQDIQMHYVDLRDVPTVLHRLAEAGLTTREACGNALRNVTCAPTAGVDPREPFDVARAATCFSKHFLRHPLVQKLPRKFKVAFSITEERDEALARINDIGLFPALRGEERGFKALVGGGLGGSPQEAQVLAEFVPEDELIPLATAILTVFNNEGEREDRAKARMKFLVRKYGINAFRRRVFQALENLPEKRVPLFDTPQGLLSSGERPVLSDPDAPRVAEDNPAFGQWKRANVQPQKQKGFFIAAVTVPLGDLKREDSHALADIAENLADGTLRLTLDQNLLLRWIPEPNLPAVYHALRTAGFALPGAGSIGDPLACPGAHTCNLAYTRSKGLAEALSESLSEHNRHAPGLEGATVKISGCFNSCGQHHIATIGFNGLLRKHDGAPAPYYMLRLGGGSDGAGSLLGRTMLKLPATRAAKAVDMLVDHWRETAGDRTFLEYCRSVKKKDVAQLLKPLTYEDTPGDDVFFDAGETKRFSFGGLGDAECV